MSPNNKTDLALVGGTVLTMNQKWEILKNTVVEISDGKISALYEGALRSTPKEVLNCEGCLVMPGLINGHTHSGMTFLRGMAEDKPLEKWLFETIFPLERKWGTREFVYACAQLAMAEMIKSGTTTFNDMYYYQNEVARAAHQAGIRGVCSQTVVEISGVGDPVSKILDELGQFVDEVKDYPLIEPSVGPHSVYGVSRKVFEKVLDFARTYSLRVNMHLSESEAEVAECKKLHGMSPPEYFNSFAVDGILFIMAHGASLTQSEIELLAKKTVSVAYNPESNMKLGNRICPVPELRKAGIAVALGTDGVASNNNLDLFQEIDIGAKLQSHRLGPGALTSRDAVGLMTIEGARALGLDHKIGSIEVGKHADLIALNINKLHAAPFNDAYAHVVYSASGADVKHSVIEGKIVLRDSVLTTLDEAKIIRDSEQWGEKIRAGL